jgi:hypothetical protein
VCVESVDPPGAQCRPEAVREVIGELTELRRRGRNVVVQGYVTREGLGVERGKSYHGEGELKVTERMFAVNCGAHVPG